MDRTVFPFNSTGYDSDLLTPDTFHDLCQTSLVPTDD